MKKNKPFGELFYCSLKKIPLSMRIAVILMFFGILQARAIDAYSQMTRLSLNFSETELVKVLDKIEDESEFFFLYNEKLLDTYRKVSITEENQLINVILDDLFSGTDVNYTIIDRKIILAPDYLKGVSQLQQVNISGKVTSTFGDPLPGVTVIVKGTTIGVTTDIYGAFTFKVPANAGTLEISYIGMKTIELPIGTQTEFNIVMETDIHALEDVVVTAFGISKQSKALTYAAQNLTSGTLAEARNLNIVTGLSGRIAGLSITQASTGVGAEAKVLLRGNRSINGSSQPIFIVDGITLNGGISNLSPDDIESISVLKGANAAALYGSRANNGAIVISTKSGEGAKEGVTSNFGFTWMGSSAILLEKFQNIYGQGANGIYSEKATVSWGPKMEGQQVAHWSIDPNYAAYGTSYPFLPQPNNIEDYFQRGNSFATNLRVSINNKNTKATCSYTNTIASGIVATNNLMQHNLNLRLNQKLTEKLTLNSDLNLVKQKFENFLFSGNAYANPMRYLYVLPRNIRSQDVQHYTFVNSLGQTRQHYWKVNDNGSGNPYWTNHNVEHPVDIQRIISMMSLKYQVTKDLSILGRSAIDQVFKQEETKSHNDTYTTAYNGAYSKSNETSYEWNSDALMNYHKSFSDITLDLNVGANHRLFAYQQIGGSGAIFSIENLFALSNTANPRPFEGYSKKVVNSAYGFGEISYKNAIFINLTGRNDWSSTLPASNRSYFYPSIGLTAVLSDLIVLPSFFTHVKLRGSYAEVGNDTEPYSLYRTATVALGLVTFSSVLPNPNLKPERTKSFETGFDLRLIKDRIRLSFTYYKTNAYDQLFSTPVPAPSGVASVFQNGADIQNTGVEITLGASVISTKNFEWDIDVNWSKNNSLVLDIAEGFDVLSFGSVYTDYIREYKLVKGQPFGEIYAKGWLRDADGNVIIQANGLPSITPGMSVRVANYNPDWLAGISNTIRYKDFNFSFLIDIRKGGTFISFTEAVVAGCGGQDYTLAGRDGGLLFGENIFEGETGVTATGEPNQATCTAESFWNNVGGMNNPVGEAFVRDASNIRMREMVFGYDLPKNLVSKTFLSSVRVSLVGRNLFFISNKSKYVDPELMDNTNNISEGREQFALPTTRTYGVSLNLGF